MRRFTLHTVITSLLIAAMASLSGSAIAQSRGERGGRARVERESRSNSSQSVQRSSNSRAASTIKRESASQRSNRSEASNWPKINRNSSSSRSDNSAVNRTEIRNRASQTRGNQMQRTFDTRKQSVNAGNHNDRNHGNVGNHNDRNNSNVGSHNDRNNSNVGNHNDRNHGSNSRPGYQIGNGGRNHGNVGNHNDRNHGNVGNHNNKGHRPSYQIGNHRPNGHMAHDHHGVIKHRPHSWHTPVAPPHRHFRPVYHFHRTRPVIIHGYRPWHRAPIIRSILGITFGTAYYASLDYLFDRGYEIDGYHNGIVYLRNIEELRCFWPDVMLNYSHGNALSGAEFHYSTGYDDLGRFNRVYRELCSIYGEPMTYQETGEGIQAVWFGGNSKGYVTLEYFYRNGRYYTTLIYGN